MHDFENGLQFSVFLFYVIGKCISQIYDNLYGYFKVIVNNSKAGSRRGFIYAVKARRPSSPRIRAFR